jgi:hypothetical protein
MRTEIPGWWCESHGRWATHTETKGINAGLPCCDPTLPGILLPCRVTARTMAYFTPDPDPSFVPETFIGRMTDPEGTPIEEPDT